MIARARRSACSPRSAKSSSSRGIDDIPEGEDITRLRHGDFVDLCRGPHVRHTGQIGAVKLLEVAGRVLARRRAQSDAAAHLRHGVRRRRTQLDEHLRRVEEAKERDHRRLGVQLELFHLDPISPGAPFWLPKGMALYNGLIDYVRSLYPKYGYQEVMAPQLFRAELFKTSGHYDTLPRGHVLVRRRRRGRRARREGA